MEIPPTLASLFTGSIQRANGEYYIQVPVDEIRNAAVDPEKNYRVALVETPEDAQSDAVDQKTENNHRQAQTSELESSTNQNGSITSNKQSEASGGTNQEIRTVQPTDGQPPVETGDRIRVTVESEGEKGDGIAKIAGGYVVVVKGGSVGDRLTVEIEAVKENFAFADIVNGRKADSTPA